MIRAVPGGCELDVRVVPGASRDQVVGEHQGALKVKVSAPPVEGAANARLVEFLSKEVLGVPRSAVRVVRGEKGRSKTLRVEAEVERVRAAVAAALARAGGG
ncbi:DUF167 domain-containing protein [Myxococcota bacterium]|nr:DUF167 domain-containing protein [Myxococcota bacterium]